MPTSHSIQAGLTIGLLALTVAACGGGGGGGGNGGNNPPPDDGNNGGGGDVVTGDDARRAVLADIADNIMLPALRDFDAEAQVLATALTAFEAAPQQDAALQTAREAWRSAANAFERIEVLQVGPAARESHDDPQPAAEDRRARVAEEGGDEPGQRPVVDRSGRADLLDPAVPDHGQPVPEGHGLGLVVRHQHDGASLEAVQVDQVGTDGASQGGVERGHRFVEQRQPRPRGHRPAEDDPLALASREGRRPAVKHVLQAEPARDGAHPVPDLGPRPSPGAQAEGEVREHAQMRIRRLVLEDHRQAAMPGRSARGRLAPEADLAVVGLFQAGDQPQQGRLARPRRPDDRQALALSDRQMGALDAPSASVAAGQAEDFERRGRRGRVPRVGIEGRGIHGEGSPWPAG